MSKSIAHNEPPGNCGHAHVWTDDFMEDAAAGRKPLLLTRMDEFTQESLEIALAWGLAAPAEFRTVWEAEPAGVEPLNSNYPFKTAKNR